MGQNYKCIKCGLQWEEVTEVLNKIWCPRCRSVQIIGTHVSNDLILPDGLKDEQVPADPVSSEDFNRAIASIPDKRTDAEKAQDDIGTLFVTKKKEGSDAPLKTVPIRVPNAESTAEEIAIFKEMLAGVMANALADLQEAMRVLPRCEEKEMAVQNLEACANLIAIVMTQDWEAKKKSLIYN